MMPAPTITTSAPATFMAVATIRQSRGVLNDLDEAHVIFYLLRADHPVRADHLSIGLTLVPAAAGRPLGDVRLQISTAWGGTAITVSLLRDLTRRLDRSVRVVVLLDPDSDGAGVRRLLRECLGRERSIRVFSVGFGTIFARDNALAGRDRRGRPVLLVPRALRTWGESAARPLDARAAQRLLGVRVVRSRLFWHGGNILFDGECLAVGADTIAENVTRLGLTASEVLAVLTAELGREVVVLGAPTSARFDHDGNRM